MDAGCCFCHWLLQTVLIIFLHPYLEVLGTARVCPQGQLMQVHTRPSYITCCYPRWCGVGQQVAACKVNGTKDACQMCDALKNQSVRTSSFTMERCSDWLLDKNCKSIHNPDRPRDFTNEQTKRCMCNIEQGKKFDPPESDLLEAPMDSYCQRRNDPCKPGFEPKVDGGCVPCKQNYFKSTEGFNLCEPKINCALLGLEYTLISNATADDNSCSVPDPVVTTKSYTHQFNTVMPVPKTTPMFSSQTHTTPTVTTPAEHLLHRNTSLGFRRRQKDESSVKWPIIGTALFLVCVLASIVLIIFCRRRGLSLRVCGKDLSDAEKNVQGHHVVKHNNGGAVHPHHMVDGSKIVNNNVNGGVPFEAANLSNGHANGNIPHEHLNPLEHGSPGLEQYTNPAQHPPVLVRPGILRASSRNGVIGQRQGNMPDMISDLGPEKLRVNLVPNSNQGEGDCLLVSGYSRGISYDDIQTWPAPAGHSPSPVQTCVNSGQVLALNGCERVHFGLVDNNPFLPAVQPNGEAVVYSPAADAVIFTRSGSVITSPVDDVGEDTAARFPRFSQLLHDGEDVSGSAENSFETCGLSPPIQLQNPNNPHLQQHGVPTAGFEPALRGCLQTGPPDHHIMNLKEQDLVNSEQTSLLSANSNTELKTMEYHVRQPSTASIGESHLTEPKTVIIGRGIDRCVEASAGANVETSPATELKQAGADARSHSSGERKRFVVGGGNERTFNEKKSVHSDKDLKNSAEVLHPPNGDSHQNVRDRGRIGDSSELKSCVKNSSSKERDSDKEKPGRYNRIVSFEENNNAQTGNKYPDPKGHPWQFPRLQNSSDKADSVSVNTDPVRPVSDTEQSSVAEGASAIDGTEWRSVHQKNTVPSSPVKASVNEDVSSAEESCSSHHNSVIYRRSQSHNTGSGSESSHKPPPRSMSEDKQHKMDRPIAKVKPMPVSDSCVGSQLQAEVSPDVTAAAAPPDLGANRRFSSSSEDSSPDPQHNTEERYSSSVSEGGDRERVQENWKRMELSPTEILHSVAGRCVPEMQSNCHKQ